MTPRRVRQVVPAQPTSDGAGVRINRVMLAPELMDPFLLLDEINSESREDFVAGFPPHPHRGFETITYMLHGAFRHRDSLGNEGRIDSGGVQWMTAGRGVIHSEMPEPDMQRLHGFQLWLNLPADDKMRQPSYRDIAATDIPEVGAAERRVRVIAGQLDAAQGPIGRRRTEPVLLDLRLKKGERIELPVNPEHQLLLYVYRGRLQLGDQTIEQQQAGLLTPGDTLALAAANEAGALLVGGKPLAEPVVQHGPFVMNTTAQIQQAVADYQAGTLASAPLID